MKDKNGDHCDVSNYRLIALATILSNMFKHVLLNRFHDYLLTSDNQFGFKRSHSTLTPIMLLKELLRFYSDHGSNMYLCFLDASKASTDRVDYSILFRKWITRKVPAYILRLLCVGAEQSSLALSSFAPWFNVCIGLVLLVLGRVVEIVIDVYDCAHGIMTMYFRNFNQMIYTSHPTIIIHAEHVVHRRGYCFDFGCMFVCLYVC